MNNEIRLFVLSIILPISLCSQIPADNCGLTVNAGPDKLVCSDNPTTILEGTVSGNGLRGFEWSPEEGLSNPRVLRPTVTVSGPECYVLTGKKKSTTSIITNGNFEMGPTGFTTDYIPGTMSCYGQGFLDCEGTYGVLNNPKNGHASWSPCGDHTSGSGNMLVCNGAPGFVNVWCQTVTVKPDHDYCISAWACSVHSTSPAQLEFSINGEPLGFLGLSGSECVWEQLQADWNSGGNTVAQICILNTNTEQNGNDFAVDDIEMFEICEQYDTVCVDIVDVLANINPPEKVCCNNPVIQLDGSGSSFGPDYMYCWVASKGGRIVSGESTLYPMVDRPGTYTLTVKGPEGCEAEVEIEVEGNLTPPKVYAEVNDSLDCDHPEVRIFGGAFPDDNMTFEWNGPNGFVSIDEAPYVTEPGTYFLTVSDDCGCSASTQVTVHEKDDVLRVQIDGSDISCLQDEALLVASTNRQAEDFTWTLPNGQTLQNDSIVARDTGWYKIGVIGPDGCEDLDSFYVDGDIAKPDLFARGDTIDCHSPMVELKAQSSASTIEWWHEGMKVSSDSTLLTGWSGEYLVVGIGDNGCRDSIVVEVETDTSAIPFDLTDAIIPCDSASIQICFDTIDPRFARYEWTNTQDQRLEQHCLTATEEGWYRLKSIGNNGCEFQDSLWVDKRESRPSVNIPDSVINCHIPSIEYGFSDMDFRMTWKMPNGDEITSDSITADTSGIYSFTIHSNRHECPLTDSFEVTADFDLPDVRLATDTLTCLRDSVVISTTTSDAIDMFEWKGPNQYTSSSSTPTVSNPGTYTLVATGANGCQDSFALEVIQSEDFPDVAVKDDTITCLKRSVEIAALVDKNDNIFEWTLPDQTTRSDSSFTTLNGGRYSVVITTQAGCEVTRELTISIDTLSPTFDLSEIDTITCSREEVVVEVSEIGSGIPEWYDGLTVISNDSSLLIDKGGPFKVRITGENGCYSEMDFVVPVDTIQPILSSANDTITCTQREVELRATTSRPALITWTTPGNEMIKSNNLLTTDGGTYVISALSDNGCSDETTIHVEVDTTAPTGLIFSDTITCREDEVWIGIHTDAPGIEWAHSSNLDGLDSTRVRSGGNYKIKLTGENGCETIYGFFVRTDTMRPSISTNNDSLTCERDQAVLIAQADAGMRVIWRQEHGVDTLSIGLTLQTDRSGNYLCEVVNPRNGCSSEAIASIEDLRELPVPEFDVVQPNCQTDVGEIRLESITGGRAPYLLSLESEDFGSRRVFRNLIPGQYQVRIKDGLGCIGIDTLTVHEIVLAESDLETSVEIELGDTVQLELMVLPDLDAIESIVWTPQEYITCWDCYNPRVYPPHDYIYQVQVTDTNGCHQFLEILVEVALPQIYIPNVFTPFGSDGINDNFFPFTNLPDEVEIEEMYIFNRWGEQVFYNEGFHPNVPEEGWNGMFRNEQMNPGVFAYLIKTRWSNGERKIYAGDVTLLR